MIKNECSIFAVILFSLLMAPLVYAEGTRGGGGAEFCAKSVGALQDSVESYDLWEGKQVHHLNITEWDLKSTKEEIIANKLFLLSKTRPGLAKMMGRVIEKIKGDLPDSNQVEQISGFEEIPGASVKKFQNCFFRQIYFWIDGPLVGANGLKEETIYRNKNLYQLKSPYFDPLSQAAIDLHEALYKIKRVYKGADGDGSGYVRKAIASLFTLNEEVDELAFRSSVEISATEVGVFPFQESRVGAYGAVGPDYENSATQGRKWITTTDLECIPTSINLNLTRVLDSKFGRISLRISQNNYPLKEEKNFPFYDESLFKVSTKAIADIADFILPIDGLRISFWGSSTWRSPGRLERQPVHFKLAISGCGLNAEDGITFDQATGELWLSYTLRVPAL